jgi:hypothetical protein
MPIGDEEAPPQSTEILRAPNRPELLKLYEAAVAEYRFQVQLNWDRAKHYLVFTGVLLGAATGLVRLGDAGRSEWLLGLMLLFTGLNAISGGYSVGRAHQYYRNARTKKAVFEQVLGLSPPVPGFSPGTSFAIETTPGMEPAETAGRRARLRLTITRQIAILLFVVGAGATVAAAIVFLRALDVVVAVCG